VPTAELLDSDAGTPAEIEASLSDLTRINRWFGGVSTALALVQHVVHSNGAQSLSLLEVAAGAGGLPAIIRRKFAARRIDLRVTILDRAPSHLTSASLPAVAGDALALPFRDSSFDLVSSSLFVHQLSPEEVVGAANEALRVCRRAALINDLVRDPVHLALVYAGFPLYRSRMTRHDAPASVRQAYTLEEMRNLLSKTGASRVEITRHFLYRMGVIAWK
jgi:ubiquinone/menaquinone biosynthesis C-methylase UbiE